MELFFKMEGILLQEKSMFSTRFLYLSHLTSKTGSIWWERLLKKISNSPENSNPSLPPLFGSVEGTHKKKLYYGL